MTLKTKLLLIAPLTLTFSCAAISAQAAADAKDDEPTCESDFALGSHMRERTCRTQEQINVQQQNTRDTLGSRGSGADPKSGR